MANFPVDVHEAFYDIQNEGVFIAGIPTMDKGYDIYIQSIIVNAYCTDNLPIEIYLQIGDNNQFSGTMYTTFTIKGDGSTFSIPINANIRGGRYELKFSKTNAAINNGRIITTNSFITGFKIPMLSQFTEKNIILSLGDSIDILNSYVTRIAGHKNLQMIQSLRQSGFDCRLSAVSISGNSLNQFVQYLKTGLFGIRKADVILIQHGANDVGQNVSNATFLSNLNYMKLYRDANYPYAKLVIAKMMPSNTSGTYFTDGTARNLIQGGFNTQINSFVSANTGNNIYKADIFTSFPSTNASYYADGIHLTQAGHDFAATLLINEMKSVLNLI